MKAVSNATGSPTARIAHEIASYNLHLHYLLFQIVHVLYQENDWVYVISESNSEGFIPHSYCAQFGSQESHEYFL